MNDEVEVYSVRDEYMKNNYVKTLSYELIENVIYFLCAYPIVAMINYDSNKNESLFYLNLIIIIPIFLMTYLRVKIRTKGIFILSIIGILVLSLIIVGFILKQDIFFIILILWTIKSIKKHSHKQQVEFNKSNLISVQILLMLQIIVIAGAGLKELQVCTVIIAIVVMLISIGYICKIRNVRLTMDYTGNKEFNKKDINIFIVGIISLSAIVMISLYKLGIFEIAYNLTNNLANSLIDIINNIINLTRDSQVTFIPKTSTIKPSVSNYLGETPNIFEQIILIVSIIVPNIALIVAITVISYLVINRILICIKKLRNKDKITFVFSDDKENEIKERVNKVIYNINNSIFLNDKEKIRRLYKDKILKYKKYNVQVNNFFSTNEIQKEVLIKADDNIEDVTRVYEKARYSNEKITKDDVEIFKCKKSS